MVDFCSPPPLQLPTDCCGEQRGGSPRSLWTTAPTVDFVFGVFCLRFGLSCICLCSRSRCSQVTFSSGSECIGAQQKMESSNPLQKAATQGALQELRGSTKTPQPVLLLARLLRRARLTTQQVRPQLHLRICFSLPPSFIGATKSKFGPAFCRDILFWELSLRGCASAGGS